MEVITEIFELIEDNFGKFWQGNGKFKVILDRVINAMGLMEDNFGKF